ncbi:hypothetical protein [Nonomuraea purpurea]|uniref:hypothetical protein n=1 Tax=Nonomuraea purpurea TaxID=1849276 RepID=UPI0036D34FB8
MTTSDVFLIEDHSEDREGLRYWTSVYRSHDYARSAVERVAHELGLGPLQWIEASFGVLLAHAQADADARNLYTVVPLQVRHRDETDTD